MFTWAQKKELPTCGAAGCTNQADPRWFIHGADGKPVQACDGCGNVCSGAPCTCPPTPTTEAP